MTQDPRYLRTVIGGLPYAVRVDENYVCEFCLSTDPRWEYPVGRVEIAGHPAIGLSEDEWLACDECSDLIETVSIGALVERCCREQRRNVPDGMERGDVVVSYPPFAIQRRRLRENIAAFMDARQGRVRPFRKP